MNNLIFMVISFKKLSQNLAVSKPSTPHIIHQFGGQFVNFIQNLCKANQQN